ncbi:hypothetical protein EWM64_g4808 [Hericium alpestre]|uniref:Uncharacterized protein n=1 Tax=Hericium alpestre TaxID=135208 RepID=A0A4Y9ZYT1_9AGAM|nr:hypothetical protein EWM64_g4808 [Hericium alpestre]
MAKGGKKGPPYTEEPEYKYIVITRPYGMKPTNRDKGDIDRVASWVCLMFNDVSAVEAVWTMNTRDEVIVQLGLHIDIEPILGAHKWHKIANNYNGNPEAVSCVFQYNYRMSGEPGMHGVFSKPYPRPSYAKPRLSNLALPLPANRHRTPTPEPVSEPVPAANPAEEPTANAAEVKSEATEQSGN